MIITVCHECRAFMGTHFTSTDVQVVENMRCSVIALALRASSRAPSGGKTGILYTGTRNSTDRGVHAKHPEGWHSNAEFDSHDPCVLCNFDFSSVKWIRRRRKMIRFGERQIKKL